ncbi:MAG: galactose mutarotase [Treponema sp.]|uniref:aldose epimerase family protein n=1 Tax=Treponema sp. TaxID=166 RepID=UPI0025CFACFA|nr:aldose epimerase family protein [Treponema sp.]MBQ9280954.1 galactose mutarotase [Treponema sp.]
MTESKKLDDGVVLYTVSREKISFSAMNLGCTITNLFVPNKTGGKTDILLGYDTLDGWKKGTEAHNAIVGRVANRIRGAAFTLDGADYTLDKNDGENCLHGGKTRYEKLLWNSEPFSDDTGEGIRFTRVSADGEQGFPGRLSLSVTYTITADNALLLEYMARTDKATPINLTNHAYFNLNGRGSVLSHKLQLDCDSYLELASDGAPSGKILSVEGTPFDFRKEKPVGQDIKEIPPSVRGYDHCMVTHGNEKGLVRFGALSSEESGIKMEMFTNQRGVHLYTANYIGGVIGKGGVRHNAQDGICFETERFPNAINEPEFPTCVLRPEETYCSKTLLKF